MAKAYTFDKTELRKRLKLFGLSDAHLEEVMSMFDRKNKRMDVVAFVITLERFGVSRTPLSNFLEDLGVDKTTIITIFSKADAKKVGLDDKKIQEVVLKG